MSRNKYPEETLNLILDVSLKLFLEKGYEHTTVQDIIDNLGGLSKGAVYHHFKSKEDILIAVSDKIFSENSLSKCWIQTKDDKCLSGSEKIKKMISDCINDPEEQKFRSTGVNIMKSPQLLSDMLNRSLSQIAPTVFQPIIEQGIADGSIKTEFPKELAEVIVLIMNIWMNPLVIPIRGDELMKKFLFLSDMTKNLGLGDVIEGLYPQIEKMNNQFYDNLK